MRIHGKVIDGPSPEVVVLPRDSGDIIFKCRAVLDFAEFERLVPEPTPGFVIKEGSTKSEQDFSDPDYLKAVESRGNLKFRWMVLKSLDATEGLTFDEVNINKPETWNKIDEEFTNSGVTPMEVSRIFKAVTEANGFNEKKMEEARERFFASQKQVAT